MARLYVETDRCVPAEQFLEAAMGVFAAKLSPRHYASLLVARGSLHAHLRRTTEARRDFQDAIAMLEALGVQAEYWLMREAYKGLEGLKF
jgi:predicted RNA polymerase sigma factor